MVPTMNLGLWVFTFHEIWDTELLFPREFVEGVTLNSWKQTIHIICLFQIIYLDHSKIESRDIVIFKIVLFVVLRLVALDSWLNMMAPDLPELFPLD